MKEVVTYVAIVMMEFNEEATCNAFYKNYKSSNGLMVQHTANCSEVVKYEGDNFSPPLSRPEAVENIIK